MGTPKAGPRNGGGYHPAGHERLWQRDMSVALFHLH
jgi:hypothetical protein